VLYLAYSLFLFQCYKKYNARTKRGLPNSYPLCAVQLKIAMDAALDTPTCMRRADPFTLTEGKYVWVNSIYIVLVKFNVTKWGRRTGSLSELRK